MRLIQLIVLALPFFLSAPVWAEEDAVLPDTIEVTKVAQADAGHGKQIFESICIHCHNLDHTVSAVGCPGLKGVLDRHNVEWLNSWLLGPEGFAKRNAKAKAVVDANVYKLIMPTIPEMQNEKDRQDIIEYLKTLK